MLRSSHNIFQKGVGHLFEKILVCLDGSKLAEQILPYAVEQARRFKSKVILLRVVAQPGSATSALGHVTGPALLEEIKDEELKAKNYLADVEKKLRNSGLDVESVTIRGTAGQSIIQYADDNEVGLIAIATHGHGGLKRMILGSVADHVLRESSLPILVLKPKASVPLD